ncbi:MAG: DUF1292 domain-containing protein [Halanaerobiales bacterium]|nr:DUF1292 domain-containing protein [Halanaerobiales bacterium]
MGNEGSYWVDQDKGELVLNNEGIEERFYIEDEILFDGSKYLVLIPVEDEESDEALLLKIVEGKDESFLSIIEDEKEFNKVQERYLNS